MSKQSPASQFGLLKSSYKAVPADFDPASLLNSKSRSNHITAPVLEDNQKTCDNPKLALQLLYELHTLDTWLSR